MTDDTTAPNDANAGSGSPRGWMIAVVVGLVVAAIGIIVLIATGDGDSDDASVTSGSVSAETTEAAATTDAPVTTEDPETTSAPETPDAPETAEAPVTPALAFAIADIDDGGTIPTNFTCDGPNDVPVLIVTAVPDDTLQLALIMDDPDAPAPDPFVHWVVYAIAADATEITDGNENFTYGLNDAGTVAWFGPCPPPGSGPHGYVFTLYALDEVIELPEDLDGRELATAIEPAVIQETEVTATFERQ